MSYVDIDYSVTERIAKITLNRPEARNSFTQRMSQELQDAFVRASQSESVRVVLLTGAGSYFCAGADISSGSFKADGVPVAQAKSRRNSSPLPEGADFRPEPAGAVTTRMLASNKPIIAAINGDAIGAGATIALAADIRVAADTARFGLVFPRRGITAEGLSHWFLPRLVGLSRAMDWMITGRKVPAAEALCAGLVRSIHPSADVVTAARNIALDMVTGTSAMSLAITRQMLYKMSPLPDPGEIHRMESLLVKYLIRQPDAEEGVRSFLEKRSPDFSSVLEGRFPGFLPWVH